MGKPYTPTETEYYTGEVADFSESIYGERPDITALPSYGNIVLNLSFTEMPDNKVLKIYRKRNFERVGTEIHMLPFLEEKGIPAPRLEMSYLDREFLDRPWVIMSKVEGRNIEKMMHVTDENLTPHFKQAGELFARIHNIEFKTQGRITPNGLDPAPFKEVIESMFEEKLAVLLNENRLTHGKADRIKEIFSGFEDSDESNLCHGDYGAWQVIIRNEEIEGVVDWEHAVASCTLFDLAKTEMIKSAWHDDFQPFMEGYRSVRDLPDDWDEKKKPYQAAVCINMLHFSRDKQKLRDYYMERLAELLSEAK